MSSGDEDQHLQAALRALVAKQEIHEALMRYCRGIDRNDRELVLSAFHDDAIDNHTGTDDPVFERFPADKPESAVKWSSHNICNELVRVDGDVAHSESYLIG